MTTQLAKKPTQRDRVYALLASLSRGTADIPEEYVRRDPAGDWVSTRYFKQVMLISEVNGRMSELRSEGHLIETGDADRYGFRYHRLVPSTLF